MQRQAEESLKEESHPLSDQRQSQEEEILDHEEIEEVLVSENLIQELHKSVDRLREFVGGLIEDAVSSVPVCVEEYCDKMNEYRVKNKQQVVEIAQRRVNKMLRNRKVKRNWNTEDITLLVWLVSKCLELRTISHFSEMAKKDWEFVSNMISGSDWQKCKYKWLSLKKVKLVAHKWSKAESKLLSQTIAQSSKINWKLVSERLYELNASKNKVFRTAKQCRQHWNCFLNPNIQKGPWTIQQDRRLLEYVLELQGSKKWSEISKFMEGRTQNALKNRFNLLVGRQRKLSGHLTQKRLVKICLNRLMLQEGQQQRMESHTPQQAMPTSKRKQLEPLVTRIETNRTPILPTVVQPVRYPVTHNLRYDTGYNSLLSLLGRNIPDGGNTMISGNMGTGNAVFFGFMFPSHFI